MKSTPSKSLASIFKNDLDEQPVRVIKAAQAGKLLGTANGHVHTAAQAHKKPEIRMVQAGPDYCDLEVVCGCGESTRVRCWNTPTEQSVAA
jgi:hypothetical protein